MDAAILAPATRGGQLRRRGLLALTLLLAALPLAAACPTSGSSS